MIISRVEITPEEFDRRRGRLRSRWAPLVENLKAASDGESFAICLDEGENTGRGRHRARQAIYAITHYHRIQITVCSTPLAILVMRVSGPSSVMSSNFDNL
jgi:hypothetical protein